MDFVSSLFDSVQANSDYLNFFGIILAALVSVYIFKGEHSISFAKEQHDNLISPLFDLLEPVLFQVMDPTILRRAIKLINANRNIADGKLLELSYYCEKSPSQRNYNKLCAYVNTLYDKSCRKLGLKIRSYSYRIERQQYQHISYFVCYVVLHIFTFLLIYLFAIGSFIGIIAYLYHIYCSLNDTFQIGVLLLLSLILLPATKLLQKVL